jgi:hypothetical protein
MLILFAPVLSLVALAVGGVASVAAFLLNGPRRRRRRAEPPLIDLPPVPTPRMRQLIEEREREPVAL